jgi:SAM-dependent methyltransferase
MIRSWKVSHIVKGMLTWVPPLNTWRIRRDMTGGSNSPRYCYSVWLRHLVMLHQYGFRIHGTRVGELGPGDSIGVGLAALLSGASAYVGLDIMPFSANADLQHICAELLGLYERREPIPGEKEFPMVRPNLGSYEFPSDVIDCTNFEGKARIICDDLKQGIGKGLWLSYEAPWTLVGGFAQGSLDLIISQAVLEHVDTLEETYRAMFLWLKPGGYASHVIDFRSHGRSPLWNGHWAYSDWEWRLVRGRREWLLNREPLCRHVSLAQKAGFRVLAVERDYNNEGYGISGLTRRFRVLEEEDVRTQGAVMVLRK